MKSILPTQLKQRISASEKITILDVREEWEYEEVNIGAMNMPLASIPERMDEIKNLKHEEVIVHCRTGMRSEKAQKYLSQNGFTHVVNLQGGIEGYLNVE